MKRSKPLQRKKPMPRFRARPRRSSRVIDKARLAAVRGLPCAARALPNAGPCSGRVQPDHESQGRGLGQKRDDRRTYPICAHHHRCRHRKAGPFTGWTRDDERVWINDQIAATDQILAAKEHHAASR